MNFSKVFICSLLAPAPMVKLNQTEHLTDMCYAFVQAEVFGKLTALLLGYN